MSKATELIEKYKVEERDFTADYNKAKDKINNDLKTISQLWKNSMKFIEKRLKTFPEGGAAVGVEFKAPTTHDLQKLTADLAKFMQDLHRKVSSL